jgi:hypothetical protein
MDREELAIRVTGSTSAGTAALVETQPVPPDEIWVLGFASLHNQSGESVTHQWALEWGSTLVLISADNTVADGKAVSTDILPTLAVGEKFAAQVTGAAKLGLVTMVVSGWRYKVRGGEAST